MSDFEIDIEKKTIDRIEKNLKSAVDDSVKQKDIDYAGAQIQSIILLRANRGMYLNQTTGGSASKRQYKSESYKKKRAKRGLPTDRVTLFYGSVGVLEGMRYRGKVRQGEVALEVGYLPGLSEARATEIAGYLNDTGAGINHVIYRYIGLTSAEERSVIDKLRRRIAGNIQDNFNN